MMGRSVHTTLPIVRDSPPILSMFQSGGRTTGLFLKKSNRNVPIGCIQTYIAIFFKVDQHWLSFCLCYLLCILHMGVTENSTEVVSCPVLEGNEKHLCQQRSELSTHSVCSNCSFPYTVSKFQVARKLIRFISVPNPMQNKIVQIIH